MIGNFHAFEWCIGGMHAQYVLSFGTFKQTTPKKHFKSTTIYFKALYFDQVRDYIDMK